MIARPIRDAKRQRCPGGQDISLCYDTLNTGADDSKGAGANDQRYLFLDVSFAKTGSYW